MLKNKKGSAEYELFPALIAFGFVIFFIVTIQQISTAKSNFNIQNAGFSTSATYTLIKEKNSAMDFVAQSLRASIRETLKQVYSEGIFTCGNSISGRPLLDSTNPESCKIGDLQKTGFDDIATKKLNEILSTYPDAILPKMNVVYDSSSNTAKATSTAPAIFYVKKDKWQTGLETDSAPIMASDIVVYEKVSSAFDSIISNSTYLAGALTNGSIDTKTLTPYCKDDPYTVQTILNDLKSTLQNCNPSNIKESCSCNTLSLPDINENNGKIQIAIGDNGNLLVQYAKGNNVILSEDTGIKSDLSFDKTYISKGKPAVIPSGSEHNLDIAVSSGKGQDGSIHSSYDIFMNTQNDISGNNGALPYCGALSSQPAFTHVYVSGRAMPTLYNSGISVFDPSRAKVSYLQGYKADSLLTKNDNGNLGINLVMIKSDKLNGQIAVKGYGDLNKYEGIFDSKLRDISPQMFLQPSQQGGDASRGPLDGSLQTLYSIDYTVAGNFENFPKESDFSGKNVFVVEYPANTHSTFMTYDDFAIQLINDSANILSNFTFQSKMPGRDVCVNDPITELLFNPVKGGYSLQKVYPKITLPSSPVDWPLKDVREITQCFGPPPQQFATQAGYNFHTGIDLVLPWNNLNTDKSNSQKTYYNDPPITSAFSGKVIGYCDTGDEYDPEHCTTHYGEYVVIANEKLGIGAVYGHLKPGSVKDNGLGMGADVKAGQEIGFVGNSGNSEGAHLHFEIFQYTKAVQDYVANHQSDPLLMQHYGWNLKRINPLCVLPKKIIDGSGQNIDVSNVFIKDDASVQYSNAGENLDITAGNPAANLDKKSQQSSTVPVSSIRPSFSRDCLINYAQAYQGINVQYAAPDVSSYCPRLGS